jgi:hypothetical protein
MSPRRIAVLALVGWYLFIPPSQYFHPRHDSPYVHYSPSGHDSSGWTMFETFDSYQACHARLESMRDLFAESPELNFVSHLFRDARCVQVEDRLVVFRSER